MNNIITNIKQLLAISMVIFWIFYILDGIYLLIFWGDICRLIVGLTGIFSMMLAVDMVKERRPEP